MIVFLCPAFFSTSALPECFIVGIVIEIGNGSQKVPKAPYRPFRQCAFSEEMKKSGPEPVPKVRLYLSFDSAVRRE